MTGTGAVLSRMEMASTRLPFPHPDDGEGRAVVQRDFEAFEDLVTTSEIKWNAGEGSSHFEAGEASGAGGGFAGFENCGADAASRPIGMDEKGADFCGIAGWIEKIVFADGRVVAAEEGFAMAPAATAYDDPGAGCFCFGDKIGAVGDELRVETENCAECAVDLFECVVVFLQAADGGFDERVESGFVGARGEAE